MITRKECPLMQQRMRTKTLKLFIENYANVNAVNIPGRVPGYNSVKLM